MINPQFIISPPALRPEEGLCFAVVLKNIFGDFCQTNYLNICRTDLHEICRIGQPSAVDERSEVTFFDPSLTNEQ